MIRQMLEVCKLRFISFVFARSMTSQRRLAIETAYLLQQFNIVLRVLEMPQNVAD